MLTLYHIACKLFTALGVILALSTLALIAVGGPQLFVELAQLDFNGGF